MSYPIIFAKVVLNIFWALECGWVCVVLGTLIGLDWLSATIFFMPIYWLGISTIDREFEVN